MADTFETRPVDAASWRDFETLFASRGSPNYCWCMVWRRTPEELRDYPKGNLCKPLIEKRIKRGETVGLLGYLAGEPVAWVSIAPRETYRDLGGPEAAPKENIWSLVCMYVRRPQRGAGYGKRLIDAAIAYARTQGATVLEAYPVDPDSPSYRFMGFVPEFEKLGFTPTGMAGSRRHVMRLAL